MIPSADMTFLLSPGDRMGLEEFLNRWEQSPELKFAELIDGVVYMPSPLSIGHSGWDGLVHSVLGYYALRSAVAKTFPNATWLLRGSAPQPDLALSLKTEYGGKMATGPRELASGLPELVVEVCRSSRSYDLGPKLALYERAGVPEYLAILIEEERFEWRILEQGRYRIMEASDGIFRSRILPGLWIDEPAFWREDESRLLAVVDQGLSSPEFLEFKQRP
jgi:Putative restriction endonuclease